MKKPNLTPNQKKTLNLILRLIGDISHLAGPVTQNKLVYGGFALIGFTVFNVNGFDACWSSMTTQFIQATNIQPVSFEVSTKNLEVTNEGYQLISFNPTQGEDGTCKVNLDGLTQADELTTEDGKKFQMFAKTIEKDGNTVVKSKIVIVPTDNQTSGFIDINQTGEKLNIKPCGVLTKHALIVGSDPKAPKLNLGDKKSFEATIKKGVKIKLFLF